MKNTLFVGILKIIVIVSFALLNVRVSAQITLTGKVTNEAGTGIPNIHLLVYKPGFASMLAFAISQSDGRFAIKAQIETDSLLVKTSSIQFHNENIVIANKTQEIIIVLKPEIKQLEGVIVKTSPIEKYGDTLSYLVQAFAQKNDRTVEDVLKRLPGITVEPGGKILYQDIPINKLYVEGMDITSGNYGVVSKNLPQGSITTVEVFENHQPIKILQDVQFSSQAALNLKLKKKIAATGTVNAGIGALPFLWQVNCTPFVFSKKNQWIISLQGNNTGENITRQILNYEDFSPMYFEIEPTSYVNLVSSQRPEISMNRYLDNQSLLFNLNSLHYISSNLQLKTNLSLSDEKISSYSSETKSLYTSTDTIETFTKFSNNAQSRNLTTKLILNRNAKENYLNNEFVFELRKPESSGEADYTPLLILQNTKNPSYRFSNSFRSIKPIGKKLLRIGSDVIYLKNNQMLGTSPVLFHDSTFTGDNPADSLNQQVNNSKIYTSNFASIGFAAGKIMINPEVGFSYKNYLLNTELLLLTKEAIETSFSFYKNNISTNQFTPYLSTEFKLKKIRYTISLTTKLSNAHVSRNNHLISETQKANFWLNEENLTIIYKIGSFWQLHLSALYSCQPGDINQYYPNYILNNYRTLSRNLKPLSLVNNYRFNGYLSYRNQIISFFNSISYTFAVSEFNYSNSHLESLNGSGIDEIANTSPGSALLHSLNGYSSKYISAIKTTASVKASFSLVNGSSMLNGAKINTSNEILTFNPGLMIRFTKWLIVDFGNTATWLINSVNNQNSNNLFLYKQNVSILMFPFDNQSLNLMGEYYNYTGKDYFFADAFYQYSITKPKIDLQLKARNIFNTSSYISLSANGYYSWVSNYQLRPFEVVLLARFSF